MLEQLVREYYPAVRRLAISIVDDAQEGDDIAQETFIAAHRALSRFRHDSQPKTWLFAIAINSCRGKLRKRKVLRMLEFTLHSLHLVKDQPNSPEQASIQNEANLDVYHAIAGLDQKHRLPVILRYGHDLSVPDIAAILQLSQGTVHSRLHYARLKLHSMLEHLDPHKEEQDGQTD